MRRKLLWLPLLFVSLSLTSFVVAFNVSQNKDNWVNANAINKTISIIDDYTTIPTSGVQLSNGSINYGHALIDSNVLAYGTSWMGAFPSTDTTVTTSFKTNNGYLIYKISSGEAGKFLKNTQLTLNLGVTSSGIYNNPYFSSSMGKANVTVEVSEDGEIYETVYSLLEDNEMYHGNENPYEAANKNSALSEHYPDTKKIIYSDYKEHGFVTYIPTISLADYVAEELYVKINLVNCKPSEIKAGSSTLQAKDVGERLYKVNISATTSSTPEAEASYYIYDNFKDSNQKMGNLHGSFYNLKTENSVAHGLIPSYEWGANVNTDNGYAIYEIPVNGNGLFSAFKSLSFKMTYLMNGMNNSNIQIYLGFSLNALEKVYDIKSQAGSTANTRSLSLGLNEYANGSKEILGASAIDNEILYLKIQVLHDKMLCSLGNIGAKLFDVTLKGKMTFANLNQVSLKYGSKSIGLRFATLIDKKVVNQLKEENYILKFANVMMPFDYIGAYGDINYDNLFSDNKIYSTEDDGKIKILITYANSQDFSSNFYAIYSSITDIKNENITRNFISRGLIVAEKDGQTKYLFGSYFNGDANESKLNLYDAAQCIINETSDYYLKKELQTKYINVIGDVVAKYTTIDVYFYKDGTTYLLTKRVCYNLIGKEVSINLDPQSSGSVISGGVLIGGKFYKYYDQLTTASGIQHISNTSGTVRADGELTLVRYYIETAL